MRDLTGILSGTYDVGQLGRDLHQARRQQNFAELAGDLTKALAMKRAVDQVCMAKELAPSKIASCEARQLRASLLALQPVVKRWPSELLTQLWLVHLQALGTKLLQSHSKGEDIQMCLEAVLRCLDPTLEAVAPGEAPEQIPLSQLWGGDGRLRTRLGEGLMCIFN